MVTGVMPSIFRTVFAETYVDMFSGQTTLVGSGAGQTSAMTTWGRIARMKTKLTPR